MENKNKWKIHVVPHTHWDKEWYFTKQDSDILLFDNIKKLLTMLENDEIDTFTYDGQLSIIDDFLEYEKDEKIKEKIIKYTKSKRFIVGPWYTQPDFYNVTSESIIRNLLVGINECKKIGADHLGVAYVPDSFGHNSQMPQIYNQFGLKNFIYWRGVSKNILENNGIINNWVGVDGSKVLSYNFLYGYWPFGANFPYLKMEDGDIEQIAKDFLNNTKDLVSELKNKSPNTNRLLVPLGGDQAPIMKRLKEFIKSINNNSNDEWVLSDYDSFFEDLNKNIVSVPEINEELKSPYLSRIHKTIGSQRQDIKLKMKELEVELYKNLEPLMVGWFINSKQYAKDFIDKVVKNILISQAHDSMGGCNSDRTNDDILNRIEQSLDIVESLKTKILKNIANNIKLKEQEIIIYNTNLTETVFNKKITIFTKQQDFSLFDSESKQVNFSILDKRKQSDGMVVKASTKGEDVSNSDAFYEYDLLITDLKIQPSDFKIISLVKEENIISKSKNDFNLDIKIKENKILIADKTNNKKIKLSLEAEVDAGDSYDYSPKQENKVLINKLVSSKITEIKQDNAKRFNIELIYEVPKSEVSTEKLKQSITLELLQFEDSTIDVKLNTKNLSTEIRWRLISESNIDTNESSFDQCYSASTRINKPFKNWKQEGWKEAPVNIESFENVVGLKNSHYFYVNGLNEYEMIGKNTLALTLFRSVSVLGRNNLLWRPGRASGTSEYNIKTDKSKLYNYDYEINFMIDLRDGVNHFVKGQEYIAKPMYYQNQNLNNLYKKFDRFFLDFADKNSTIKNKISISNNDFIVKSVKKSENGNDVIIRGYNPIEEEINFNVLLNGEKSKVKIINLKEEVVTSGVVDIKVKQNQIISILLPGKSV
ncbi:glycosyl hydrolase-related protein [Spiroplasma endosymbiont of Othius punctulatus]|uniref:glycoside hydrolase family 38 N-terminal domain-containing protein n=1 Tax=Spiroplasma endosymbiont of Othius punctulatus TaxID=3066289 RepID=UPI0030CA7CD9